jgi:hypothetical protein
MTPCPLPPVQSQRTDSTGLVTIIEKHPNPGCPAIHCPACMQHIELEDKGWLIPVGLPYAGFYHFDCKPTRKGRAI